MRRFALAGILLAVSVVPARAGWLGGGGPGLPKALNLNQPRVVIAHGAPHVERQETKYGSPTWGSDWARAVKHPNRPLRPSLR